MIFGYVGYLGSTIALMALSMIGMTKTDKALVIALLPFGIGMLLVGLLFGLDIWKVDSAAARYLLLAAGLGGSGYIFVRSYRALRQ